MPETVGRATLPKAHRLHKNSEFQRVYKKGRRFSGQGFLIVIAPGAMDCRRLGISVGKKTGGAVRRNRIKRLIREVFRLNRDRFPPASDIVFTVRPGFGLDDFFALRAAVVQLLQVGMEREKQ